MRYDFRDATLPKGSVIFQSKLNFVHDSTGMHLWCRRGAGAGWMLKQPHSYGSWKVNSRISAGSVNPGTKVCELLWPAGTGWPPELDFNESGDRKRSNQTLHLAPDNEMRHSHYPVDQTKWHTYEVNVTLGTITYLCDGEVRAAISNEAPGTAWNLHVRTQPHYDTESETVLDVRWVEVPG